MRNTLQDGITKINKGGWVGNINLTLVCTFLRYENGHAAITPCLCELPNFKFLVTKSASCGAAVVTLSLRANCRILGPEDALIVQFCKYALNTNKAHNLKK